ncbi:hypothetical protein L208DRAFT_1335135, partial [Tricholoma matsutake]
VLNSSVAVPQYLGSVRTGCGCRLPHLGVKNRTEPDLQTLKQPELIQEIKENPILRYRECDIGMNYKALIGHGEYKHNKYTT